jgi:hypothetical protein
LSGIKNSREPCSWLTKRQIFIFFLDFWCQTFWFRWLEWLCGPEWISKSNHIRAK